MPTYKFKDKNTGKVFTEFMTISARDKYVKDNPHLEQLVNGFPGMVDPTRVGRVKPDDGFRDVLREMKKKHRGAKINTF